jgi:hypothetical protein
LRLKQLYYTGIASLMPYIHLLRILIESVYVVLYIYT